MIKLKVYESNKNKKKNYNYLLILFFFMNPQKILFVSFSKYVFSSFSLLV